jgi:hypothetical protein
MNAERQGALRTAPDAGCNPLDSRPERVRWSGDGGRQERGRAMPPQHPADDVQGVFGRVHDVHTATAVDVGLDKSRNNGQVRGIDADGAAGYADVTRSPRGIDATAANNDAPRGETFEWGQE